MKFWATLVWLPDDLIDSRTELIDIWPDFDSYLAEETNATLYFRASDEAKTTGTFQLEDSNYFLLEDGSKLRQELPVTFGDWRVLNRNASSAERSSSKQCLSLTAIPKHP